ncbi:MAG: nuclear transport factor 2 family protein [Chloroflexi bacterium]|nr:nuclear transport factor 2 family protein [Chloroflexota bacterium]
MAKHDVIHQDGQQYCSDFLAAYRATNSNSEALNREVLERYVAEGVNVGNFELARSLVAPDFVSHNPLGEQKRDEMIGALTAMREAFSGFNMSVSQATFEGDRVANIKTITGVFDKPMPSPNGPIPPTGQPVKIEMVCITRLQDGLLVED